MRDEVLQPQVQRRAHRDPMPEVHGVGVDVDVDVDELRDAMRWEDLIATRDGRSKRDDNIAFLANLLI